MLTAPLWLTTAPIWATAIMGIAYGFVVLAMLFTVRFDAPAPVDEEKPSADPY